MNLSSEMIESKHISLDGDCKLYKFNTFLSMKLVLKFKEEVKLYSSTLNYDNIVTFVCREFSIDPSTLHISFLDQDNDDITILSNDDIEVMQAVFEDKEYVKVNVTGEFSAPAEQEETVVEIKEVSAEEVDKTEIKPVEQIQPAQEEIKKVEEPVVAEEKAPEEIKYSSEEKREWGNHRADRMRAFEKVESYLSETVARLVDERVKSLIPCLKEQILNHAEKKAEPKGLIHEGVECKGCLVKPIIGVRYDCPSCPDFILCEQCEEKIDHDHNLLKIKKIVEKKEEEKSGLGHCLKKIFKHHGHHGHHRGRSSSSSREKCHWKGPHWAMRKCWGLSMMFGGKPEDYRAFVEENGHLRPRQTFKKYAELQGLTDEDFRQRFIDMRCQKLSYSFGKPAQEYRAFVEKNYESRYRELVGKLEESGERSEGRKCRWGGKRFNFNEGVPEYPFKKEEVKEEQVQEEPKKKEENNSVLVTDSLLELPKKESPEVSREKGAILLQMQDIFGKENTKEYFKFIDLHYKDGLESVVQRWIEQAKNSKVNK